MFNAALQESPDMPDGTTHCLLSVHKRILGTYTKNFLDKIVVLATAHAREAFEQNQLVRSPFPACLTGMGA